jgi:hypothetical protein
VKNWEYGRPLSLAVRCINVCSQRLKSLGLGRNVQNCHASRDTEATVLKYEPRLVSMNKTIIKVVAASFFVACCSIRINCCQVSVSTDKRRRPR